MRLPEAVPLVPITALPTANVEGVGVNCPAAAIPVPDRRRISVGLDAFDVIVTPPLSLPADAGLSSH
jgi:hypothetical protein